MYPAYQKIQNNPYRFKVFSTKTRITNEKELNPLTGLALAHALYDWLDGNRQNDPGEEIILAMAKEVQVEANRVITLFFDYLTNTQKNKVAKVVDEIATVFDNEGEQFTVYINLTSAVLEDILRFEKLTPERRQGIENVFDCVDGLLTQFDEDYSDIASAEKADKAFKIWKRRKF